MIRVNQPEGRLPLTIPVLFVDHTPGGELAKRLKKVEDILALITGFIVKVTERLAFNTIPLEGHGLPDGRLLHLLPRRMESYLIVMVCILVRLVGASSRGLENTWQMLSL